MGHDGAWAAPGEASSAQKINILKQAGVIIVDHPEMFSPGMKQLLNPSKKSYGTQCAASNEEAFTQSVNDQDCCKLQLCPMIKGGTCTLSSHKMKIFE